MTTTVMVRDDGIVPLDVRPVDPRDEQGEVWNPAYRVYFWRSPGASFGYQSREFELTGGDAPAVFAWAAANAANDETYTVYARVDTPRDVTLVRLAGDDPTRAQ
jgi:hypothetical protein